MWHCVHDTRGPWIHFSGRCVFLCMCANMCPREICAQERRDSCVLSIHWPHFTPKLQITLSSFINITQDKFTEQLRSRPGLKSTEGNLVKGSSVWTPLYIHAHTIKQCKHLFNLFLHKLIFPCLSQLACLPFLCVFLHLLPSPSKTSSTAQLKLLLCLWLVCCLRHFYISTFQSNYLKWVSPPACYPCQIITVFPWWSCSSNKEQSEMLGKKIASKVLLYSQRGSSGHPIP